MKTILSTCAPGPYLFENGFDKPATRQWCNAHLSMVGSPQCERQAIVVDTEHPMYGTLATLVYPSDRYPYVVVGGSKSGSTLYFAPVETLGFENGHWYTRDEALAHARPERAMTLRLRKRTGTFENMSMGSARTYLAREV